MSYHPKAHFSKKKIKKSALTLKYIKIRKISFTFHSIPLCRVVVSKYNKTLALLFF